MEQSFDWDTILKDMSDKAKQYGKMEYLREELAEKGGVGLFIKYFEHCDTPTLESVKLILDKIEDPTKPIEGSVTLLYFACACDKVSVEIIEYLLGLGMTWWKVEDTKPIALAKEEAGEESDEESGEESPLFLASKNLPLTKYLVEKGWDVNWTDPDGDSILDRAENRKTTGVYEYLKA